MSFVAGLRPLDTSPVSSPGKDRSKNMMVVVKISDLPGDSRHDFFVSLTIESEVMALSAFI